MFVSTTRIYDGPTSSTLSYSESMRYLLEKFEDIAWINAETNGFGLRNDSRGYGWFLIKYSLSFEESIDLSCMSIKTWPYFTGGVSCGRGFEMRNSEGIKLAEADSLWGLVDIKSERILSPYKVFSINTDSVSTSGVKKFIFPRFNFTFDTRLCSGKSSIEVNNSTMIDTNKHVNNTNYIIFLLDPIDKDFYRNYYVSHIDIHYKKQILYGSKIQSIFVYDPNTKTTEHSIIDITNGQVYCQARMIWNRRSSIK